MTETQLSRGGKKRIPENRFGDMKKFLEILETVSLPKRRAVGRGGGNKSAPVLRTKEDKRRDTGLKQAIQMVLQSFVHSFYSISG